MDNNTTLSLLIAEMLGDIGKLHDAVEGVKQSIPAMTELLQGFIDSIDKATVTALELHQAKLAEVAVQSRNDLASENQAVLTVLNEAKASLQALIDESTKTGLEKVSGASEAILNSVVDFADSKIAEAIKATIHETLGAELRKLSDFDKEVAKLKKELLSVSTQMLEHRQRGATDAAIAVKAEIDKIRPSFIFESVKIIACVFAGMVLYGWYHAIK